MPSRAPREPATCSGCSKATTTRVSCALRGSTPVYEITAILDQVQAEGVDVSLPPTIRFGVQSMVMGMLGRFDEARRLSDEAMRLAIEFRGRVTRAMYQVGAGSSRSPAITKPAERFIGEGYDDLVSLGNVVNSSTFAGYRARRLRPPRARADEARRWAEVCRETDVE